MVLYDTLSKSKKSVVPLHDNEIRMYACGPTVYDFTHLGHLRKYVMDDVLVRTLRGAGFEVKHVMNITDVGHLVSDADEGEDKMEKGARKHGLSVWEVAKTFEAFFWKSMQSMNVHPPTISCRATDHIPEQIQLIQTLEKNGFTYVLKDGVYFDSTKFSSYGELANLKAEELQAGSRVEMVEGKRHATDFALWKFSPANEQRQMEWESPWGKGFPGWHIECSAMAMKYLGPRLDIHTGGIDHIPVHHTNEIAQSEAATGEKPFSQFWVHHNFLRIQNEKMSKSLGNFFTIEDVIAHGFSPMALRLLFLSAHYRSEFNFTWENLAATQKSWERLVKFSEGEVGEITAKGQVFVDKATQFLQDDLRTPEASAILWEVMKSDLPDPEKRAVIRKIAEAMGLSFALEIASKEVRVPAEVTQLAEQRWQLKQAGKYAEADAVRAQISRLGWEMQETKSAYSLRKLGQHA